MRIILSLILLFLVGILRLTSSQQTINFIPDILSNNTLTEYTMRSEPIEVDLFVDKQLFMMVENMAPLKIHCRVSSLKDDYSIKKAYLCWKMFLNSDSMCINVVNIKTAKFDTTIFDINFQKLKGFSASLINKLDTEIHGYFYCELKNDIDSIISNNIEIHNLRYYNLIIRNLLEVSNVLEKKDIINGNIFDCGKKISNTDINIPQWIRPLLMENFKWFACAGEPNDGFCLTSISKALIENEHFKLFSNNSIQLFDNIFSKFHRLTLQCVNIDSRIYSSFDITSSKRNNYLPLNKSFIPKDVTVEMRARVFFKNPYSLSAVYISANKSYYWLKDSMPLNGRYIQRSHSLIFPNTIENIDNGTYTLTIYQLNPQNTMHFKFHVRVIDCPQASNGFAIPSVSYIMSKQSLNLKMKFEGDLMETITNINKIRISTNNEVETQTDLRHLKKTYPYLKSMKLSILKKVSNNSTSLNYISNNIDGLWFKEGYSHRITFGAANHLGSLIVSTLVKVIEPPKWKTTLNKYNCYENCYISEPHYFKCSIYPTEYINMGLTLHYKWKLNGVDIDLLFSNEIQKSYFDFDNGLFILKKISTNDKVQDLRIIDVFRNTTLSCSIILSAPIKQINGRMIYQQVYDSQYDFHLLSSLSQAKIILTSNDFLPHSTFFIAMIISILLIVTILGITILTWAFYKFGSGETYDIDKMERSAGKDPEKENQDSHFFKHYHREEESDTTLLRDIISWSHHSSEKDTNDTVLNESAYSSDSFDEGSIIGQYGIQLTRI